MSREFLISLAGLPMVVACASSAGWQTHDASTADLIEMSVDAHGIPLEVEFHMSPDAVPAVVRDAMDRLHPGGTATGAEKEFIAGGVYWEVTKSIDGRDFEAMFHPDGRLHSEELEVQADAVPAAVQSAVHASGRGEVTKWEEIRDADGALVEYHVKLASDGRKYKLRVSSSGEVLAVLREVPAEIEVPVQ